jgi:hypothetical protein
MDKRDIENLEFIMSLKIDDLKEWYESLSDDDMQYAIELVKSACAETALKVDQLCEVEDLADAKAVLAKFTLKGSVE